MVREAELAVRIAALPLLGALSVVSAVRDQAARRRLTRDEGTADSTVAALLAAATGDLADVRDWLTTA